MWLPTTSPMIAGEKARRRGDTAVGVWAASAVELFECDVRSRREVAALRGKLREFIDPIEDQVRLYPLDERAARQVTVLGPRVIEERQDFWIVT